jgi:hypothetical protein
MRVGALRNQAGKRRFPGAWGAPQNQGVELAALNGRPQGLAGTQHLGLADKLIERAGPHPVGERPQRLTAAS